MSSFLKKFQLLKRKSLDNSSEDKTDRQEGPSLPHHPSSHDPAGRRTSQLLPLLIKPASTTTSEDQKKPPPPPLVLPGLVQRQLTKASTNKLEDRHPQLPDTAKEATILPKLPVKPVRNTTSPAGRRKATQAVENSVTLPELADENFRYIWNSKVLPRGKTLQEAVEMLDEREVFETILSHLQKTVQPCPEEAKTTGRKRGGVATEVEPNDKAVLPQIKLPRTTSKEKISLYRYYGVKLRDTRHKEIVNEYLQLLLVHSVQDDDQTGVSEAVGLAASCHLREILMVLRDYGNMMRARRSLVLEKTPELQDQKTRGAIQVRITLILCYGHAASGAKPDDLLMLIEFIISELLIQFHAGHKDETLKTTFMKSVVMVSTAFQGIQREDIIFPHKSELVLCIIEVIEEEPLGSVCFTILHQAMTTVCSMTHLKPVLEYDVKSDLVRKSIKKVFSLPALKMTKLKAGSPNHPMQTQDFYLQTINVCNTMLTSLLSEAPNIDGLQDILIHTNGWIESEKTYERERAVRSTIHVLKFASEHLDFDLSQEFSLLGQMVAVLGMRTMDSVKEIGLQAAEAMYHLHYLTMSKMVKEMEKKHKNKKGNIVKWMREDFFISGPSIFYNNISKVAKAFGEHLSSGQITDLVLKIINNLMHEDRLISQAASMLLSSFLEECGMDVEDLPLMVKEIYSRLSTIRDVPTKEETMKAICSLASKRLSGVVDCLLEASIECDRNAMELWKALVADPYSNVKLVRPLLKRLQDEDPQSESYNRRNSKSLMPLAATNALRWILTLPEAADVVQGKFPHLLIALVTQIYYSLGSSRKGSKRSNNSEVSDLPCALSSGVQALKSLISCMGFCREYNLLGMNGTWEKLQQPDTYFEGVFQLVRVLFTFTKVHLKVTFKQANTYLRRLEVKERTVGMAFFTELLFHGDIGQMFVKQDILDVLREWMLQPHPLMQLFSIRGLGHLLQHPLEDESLQELLPPLMSCAFDLDRAIVKEAIKTLQYMFQHIDVEENGSMGISLIPQILQYFSDEDDDLRADSIGLFGTLLKGAAVSGGNRVSVKEDVFRSQVPLLIQLADPVTREVAKNVLSTCTAYMKWADIPAGLFGIENFTNLDHVYSHFCKYLLRKYKNRMPEILEQTAKYLKSKSTLHREAAGILIGIYAPHLTADIVTCKEIEEAYLAVRELQGDCEDSVSTAAITTLEQLLQHCGNRISRHLIPH